MKRLFFVICCAALLCACMRLTPNRGDDAPSGEKVIAILSVNDAHSNIDMFPHFAALADSLRQVYPDLLLFSAGDNRTGNPVNDQYGQVNAPMINLMNRVGFDAAAVGNHDWDGGVDNLKANAEQADFPFLCANVSAPDELELRVEPFVIIENQGVKIAVVSFVEVNHDGIPGAHPSNFSRIRFEKGIDVLPRYRYLRDECDVMIALTHLGYEDDIELARSAPYLDEIIGGHSHTLVEQPAESNGVLITQAASYMKYATLSLLKVKDGKVVEKSARNLDVKRFAKTDSSVASEVAEYNDSPTLNETIAVARTSFDTPESLGCLITDAMRAVSGADFAFVNTGGIRMKHFDAGPITVKDVYSIDPFNNDVVVFTMTGEQIERFVLDSYRRNGRNPSYVSGMDYRVEKDRKGREKGVTCLLGEGVFSKSSTYKVAINSYMASTIRIESLDDGMSQFMTSEEMVIRFLRQIKDVDYQCVSRTR